MASLKIKPFRISIHKTHSLIAGISVVCILATLFFANAIYPKKNAQVSTCVAPNNKPEKTLLHASMGYASFYSDYNEQFTKEWKCKTGQSVRIEQLFGASGDTMRRINTGDIQPDIITMSNPAEIESIVENTGIISRSWKENFPYESSPFYSAVVFLVRKGNPKNIQNWDDLIKPGIKILASNPKTCGGGRWVYTAVLGIGHTQDFVSKFYANMPIVYANQGIAADAFIKDHIGDVLVTYERLVLSEIRVNQDVQMIDPSETIAMDVPVAIAIKNTEKNNTTEIATAYINGLYKPETQDLIAKNFFRPRLGTKSDNLTPEFPNISLFTRQEIFDKNATTESDHLGDGGIFDSVKRLNQ